MATAVSIIKTSLRLIGALAAGEDPSPEDAADALTALRALIESENNNNLSIYQIQDETFTLPANERYQTIGVGGDWNTVWPVTILDSSTLRDPTVDPAIDLPLWVISQAQHASIMAKGVTGNYPQYLYYDRGYPLGKVYFWTVPTSNLEVHLATWKPLTDFSELTTQVNLPPGYERFITYALAMELAPQFGVEPSPTVVKTAAKSRVYLQRVNSKDEVMSMPAGLPGGRRLGYWDFYSGGQ